MENRVYIAINNAYLTEGTTEKLLKTFSNMYKTQCSAEELSRLINNMGLEITRDRSTLPLIGSIYRNKEKEVYRYYLGKRGDRNLRPSELFSLYPDEEGIVYQIYVQ